MPAAPAEPTDETIRLAVENEVLRSGVIEGHEIDVSSEQGLVTLSDRVHNLFARQIASRLAQRVRGVQSVINEIEIVGLARDDAAIQKDIEAALQADPATSALKVSVKVEGARATLTGEVPAHGLKTLAGRVASKVKGLLEIDNQLVPDAKSRPDDAELKAAPEPTFGIQLTLALLDCSAAVHKARGCSNQVHLDPAPLNSFAKAHAGEIAQLSPSAAQAMQTLLERYRKPPAHIPDRPVVPPGPEHFKVSPRSLR